jgi:hypothetical protein
VNGLEHLVGCAVRGTVGPVQNKGASVPSKFSSPTGPRRFPSPDPPVGSLGEAGEAALGNSIG